MTMRRKGPAALARNEAQDHSRNDANDPTLPACLRHEKPDPRMGKRPHYIIRRTAEGYFAVPFPGGASMAKPLGKEAGESWREARKLAKRGVLINGDAR